MPPGPVLAVGGRAIVDNTTESSDTTDERILDATLAVLARGGVAGVSMRAVAREADVSVGLANYYFENKSALISAALVRVGEQDAELVAPASDDDAAGHLARCLARALDPSYLAQDYLSLRLQLWSLAGIDERFAEINRAAQKRYLDGLADLIEAARPDLSRVEIEHRAADILIEQNGGWLTAILIRDRPAIDRAVERCNSLAFD